MRTSPHPLYLLLLPGWWVACTPEDATTRQTALLSEGSSIDVVHARIGCLDIQRSGNLTAMVAAACDGETSCSFKAPSPGEYRAAGVTATTRVFCTQAMEIRYRCGVEGRVQTVMVRGDAWDQPPAFLTCGEGHVSTLQETVAPEPEACTPPTRDTSGLVDYYLPRPEFLDWTNPTREDIETEKAAYRNDLFKVFSGFKLPDDDLTPTDWKVAADPTVIGSPASVMGQYEGRLHPVVRAYAGTEEPIRALCSAARLYDLNTETDLTEPSDRQLAHAIADLTVTGKQSFRAFRRTAPSYSTLKDSPLCLDVSDGSIRHVLARAYDVANAIRTETPRTLRAELGWIAVSGEDDPPHRPVNVPSSPFPQMNLSVRVPGTTWDVDTRYSIAKRRGRALQRTPPLVDSGEGHFIPGEWLPDVDDDSQVVLFIHGMDSRLEESLHLTRALHELPDDTNWTVLSLDLPTSGYSTHLDSNDPTGQRRADPLKNPFHPKNVRCRNTPLLDYLEDFIVAFVDRLDDEVQGRLKPRIAAVAGGSLGGSMTLRLARRPRTEWVTHAIPWSPASTWHSMGPSWRGCDTGFDLIKAQSVTLPLKWSGMDEDGFHLPANERPNFRRTFFYGGFDWSPAFGFGGPPQAECWQSDNWPCKAASMQSARLDRHETYSANFRAWHWRLAAEQLAFSHRLRDELTGERLYTKNEKPLLLMCGADDTCGNLCEETQDMAASMTQTPGRLIVLEGVGHAMDAERPEFLAHEIASFLSSYPANPDAP